MLDLMMPAVATPVAAAEPAPTVQAPGPVDALGLPVVPAPQEAHWPCGRCESLNVLTANVCVICGQAFLGGASSEPSLVLPLVGDLSRMSRGQRIGLALGAVGALLLPLAIITLLLTGSPPPADTVPTQEITTVDGP